MKPFDLRRKQRAAAAAEEVKGMTLAELLAKDFPPSSEERLDALPPLAWSPDVFGKAACQLAESAGLTVRMHRLDEQLPPLSHEVKFKYTHEYEELQADEHRGRSAHVITVREDGRVIAFGIANLSPDGDSEISIIDVDVSSRRDSGLNLAVEIASGSFTVGVGHILVQALVEFLPGAIHVDATNARSRYIFKSLGFLPADEKNPCLLRRPG